MSEAERYQAYIAAINEASHLYGFQVNAQVQPEMLGQVVQVRAVMAIAPIPNWQPPASISPNHTPAQATIVGQEH